MDGYITVSAKTLDDAITEALIQLGVTSDHLDYEVIEKGSAGFLGIGMKQAVIKARRKQEEPVEEPVVEEVEEKPVKKEVKEFKENPDKYKAHVGDVSTVLRVALTGRTNTPDMYEIMQVLGKESIIKRFEKAKEQL